jgi:hypothetical protein
MGFEINIPAACFVHECMKLLLQKLHAMWYLLLLRIIHWNREAYVIVYLMKMISIIRLFRNVAQDHVTYIIFKDLCRCVWFRMTACTCLYKNELHFCFYATKFKIYQN